MAKEYLDKTGLTYLWSKIKTLLNGKQDTLVSGTNIKTINNTSLLGSGNISIGGGSGGTSDYDDLSNKPQINGVTLAGNKTTSDLGVLDDLFFQSGETYSVTYSHARALTGYISSSTTGIYFEVPLPKFLSNVNDATITAMTGGVRGVGGYVNGLINGSNLKSGYTVTASVDNPNTLYVSVVKSSALTNATNNTPASIALNSISITFS